MAQQLQHSAGEAVRVERRGHVLIVILNRPDARNAINLDVTMGVGEALELAQDDSDIWVVVITGGGGKSFCAGADLKAAASGELMPHDPRIRRWGFAGYVHHRISKPTIAAVNGFALGGGTEIVLASDLAVAVGHATFGLPKVRRGIFAAADGAFRLGQQIPKKVAMEATLTGQPITAARHLNSASSTESFPRIPSCNRRWNWLKQSVPTRPSPYRRAKGSPTASATARCVDDEHWLRTASEGVSLMSSQDAREGLRAFAEKREPVWPGK